MSNNSFNRKQILGFSRNIFFLGLVSFFTDISSEMIFTLVPLFLVNVLGAAPLLVGLVGGISDSTEALLKIYSGRLADKTRRHKALALIGYGVSTVAKPFMYMAGHWVAVTGVRFADRVGKGLRTSPRDALLSESCGLAERGKSFGLHKAMDSAGAFLGLFAAAVIIYLTQAGGLELTQATFQKLVLVGVAPAIIAVIVLALLVKDIPASNNYSANKQQNIKVVFHSLNREFKLFLLIMGLFTLGNSSDFFIILRAQNLGNPVLTITLMLVVFNMTYAMAAIPAGMLSDKLGRRFVIIIGWSIYALTYLGFAVSNQSWQIWVLFALYGVYYGIIEGVAKAFIADLVPSQKRGTAYGLYHGIVGFALLPASLIAGFIWQEISPAGPFYFGATIAAIAIVALWWFIPEEKGKSYEQS